MTLVVTDYSTVVFRDGIPSRRGGKFVHLFFDNCERLVLAPLQLSRFHANISERFCSLNTIAGRYVKKPDLFAVLNPGLELFGGGEWAINEEARSLRLSGCSATYGKFHSDGLAERLAGTGRYPGYNILVK